MATQEVCDVDGSDDEIVWRDDRVRWAEDFKNEQQRPKTKIADDVVEEDEEEAAFMDPFKDPDPFQMFEFDFEYSSSSSMTTAPPPSSDGISNVIHISLRGYKEDADQVWQSTGVTLWRASEYLCRYLLRRQIESDNHGTSSPFLKGKKILEVRSGIFPIHDSDAMGLISLYTI